MRSAVHRNALLLCLVAAPGLSGSPHGAIAQTSPSPPTFPSAVDLITVDAVVVDGKGRPVPGLTREDFVLTEDGRPQPIVTFEAVEGPATPMAPPADPDSDVIATNSAPPGPGRAFAVMLDDVWIKRVDVPAVRDALTQFLERSVQPGDEVRLANTTGDVHWSGRIPEGREDLLAVVARVGGRGPDQEREVFVDSPKAQRREDLSRAPSLRTLSEYNAYRIVEGYGYGSEDGPRNIAEEIDFRRRARMRLTHAALRRELEALSSVVGRKSLLLVTRGFIQDLGDELRETTRIAHEANVAIYFLDVRGLQTTPGYSAALGAAPDPTKVVKALVEQDVHDTAGSQDLASDTGGYSIRNTNDFAGGLDRVTSESRVFYMLGFHPPPGKSPGEWRKLRVTVRRPGLTVRARRGYWLRAPDRARSMPGTPPGASIPVRLASYVLEPVEGGRIRVAVAIEIDVSGLLAPPGDAPLRVRLEASPRDGDMSYTQDVFLDRNDAFRRGGWQSARVNFALRRDVYRLRAEVDEPASGRRGIVEQRVAVPDAALFRLSTPVLSDVPMPPSDAGLSAPAPVAHRRFSASGGRPLLYSFSVVGAARDPSSGQPDVRFRLAVKDRSGRTLVEAPDAAVAPSSDGRLEQVVGLPLAQMAEGEYELEVAIQDRVASKAVERKETFVVEAAPSPAPTAAPEPLAADRSQAPADLAPLLERAGRYVVAYQQTFSDLVVDEDYDQQLWGQRGRQKRHSRADMLFVSLPGPIPWAVFRDVYEVDGKKVRDREARLERLFRGSPDGAAAAAKRAKAIQEESARFNLGPVRRTLNVPTFALLVLHPDHQHRFSFESAGREPIDGTETVQIAFTEKVRPTLVAGAGGDVLSKGRVWIDDQGTVLRTEISYRPEGENWLTRTRTQILTEYGPEPRLKVTVPIRMTETYELGERTAAALLDDPGRPWTSLAISAVARYSGYRRFDVTTEEEYIGPPEEHR